MLMDRRVVRADDKGHAVAPELLERMGFVGRHRAREPIADRTDLDADASLGQQLQQDGVFSGGSPVTNSISIEQLHGMSHILWTARLACMDRDAQAEAVLGC